MKTLIAALALGVAAVAAAPAMAQPPGQYRDWDRGRGDGINLSGLSVDQAKQQLSYAGYNKARSIKISGQQWDLWLSNRGRDCVGFTSYKGRVTDTRSFRNDECGGGYNDGGWSGGGGWGGGFGNPDRLVGLSVDQAKNTLANAGFQKARSTNIYGKQWDLWFDDRSRGGRCVGFTSLNGRVSNADTFDDQDCY